MYTVTQSHIKRLMISCLGGWQDMYTEQDVNITRIPPPPLGKKLE